MSTPSPAAQRWRRVLRGVAVAGALYLGVAYFALPRLWIHHEHHPAMAGLPTRTVTADGIPGDPVNVALIGSEAELVGAFARAGWRVPAALGLRADLGIGESVVLDRPDPTAPVSSLFLFGRQQDLAFEQEVGRSARQRHHVRFWRSDAGGDGPRPLWLGAASFDRGVGLSRTTGQVTHHISPDLDAERDHVLAELAAAGQLEVESQVSGVGPTLDGHNGGGDRFYTDGEIDVGVLTPGNRVATRPPEQLANPPAVALEDWAWSQARPLLRRTLAADDD